MVDIEVIRAALTAAGQPNDLLSMRSLSGGCIHQVIEVTLRGGGKVVAKVNSAANKDLFDEEAHGLRALASSKAVLTPSPLAVTVQDGHAVFLMTALQPARGAVNDQVWRRFGADLAALHSADAGSRYGFDMVNHIGSTLQPNDWRDDWGEFNSVNRLGFQLETALDAQLLQSAEGRRIQAVIDRLDRFIPRRPKPALLHGDLWSGNALAVEDSESSGRRGGEARIAMIDPACSIGDGYADIAMMKLFGGFPAACFNEYHAKVADRENTEARITVYQLYHVLNHLNIFGRGYASQALAMASRLIGS